jgi:hypothetical protein
VGQKDKSIPFATQIGLRSEECEHLLTGSCIWDEMFEAIYRVKREHGILPDVRTSMLETCAAGKYWRF